jgi:hypothetical protein
MRFSPDGKRLAYMARNDALYVMVIDGKPAGSFPIIILPAVFSSDGRRLAFAAQSNQKQVMVIDGQTGPEYDAVQIDSLAFSADGQHVAYLAHYPECIFILSCSRESRVGR